MRCIGVVGHGSQERRINETLASPFRDWESAVVGWRPRPRPRLGVDGAQQADVALVVSQAKKGLKTAGDNHLLMPRNVLQPSLLLAPPRAHPRTYSLPPPHPCHGVLLITILLISACFSLPTDEVAALVIDNGSGMCKGECSWGHKEAVRAS